MTEETLKSFYDAWMAADAILRFCEGKVYADYQNDELLASAVPILLA